MQCARQAACAVPEQFKVISGFQTMNYKVLFPPLNLGLAWGNASSMHDAHPYTRCGWGGTCCNYRASLGLAVRGTRFVFHKVSFHCRMFVHKLRVLPAIRMNTQVDGIRY